MGREGVDVGRGKGAAGGGDGFAAGGEGVVSVIAVGDKSPFAKKSLQIVSEVLAGEKDAQVTFINPLPPHYLDAPGAKIWRKEAKDEPT
jgi:hypothetical protein